MRELVSACSVSASTTADAIAAMGSSLSDDVRGAALQLLRGLALVRWGAQQLCASEGLVDLLLTMESVHAVPATELRSKHAVATALAAWPEALDSLGATTAGQIRAYVAAGPFAPQRARAARMAAPLTL